MSVSLKESPVSYLGCYSTLISSLLSVVLPQKLSKKIIRFVGVSLQKRYRNKIDSPFFLLELNHFYGRHVLLFLLPF